MNHILTAQDIDSIAQRVVEILGERLARAPTLPAPSPQQAPPGPESLLAKRSGKLAYSLQELSAELGLSKDTLYRFEARGLLRSLPGVRHKFYSYKEVERFLSTGSGDPPSWLAAKRSRPQG